MAWWRRKSDHAATQPDVAEPDAAEDRLARIEKSVLAMGDCYNRKLDAFEAAIKVLNSVVGEILTHLNADLENKAAAHAKFIEIGKSLGFGDFDEATGTFVKKTL